LIDRSRQSNTYLQAVELSLDWDPVLQPEPKHHLALAPDSGRRKKEARRKNGKREHGKRRSEAAVEQKHRLRYLVELSVANQDQHIGCR
jgi:hypothetical protein